MNDNINDTKVDVITTQPKTSSLVAWLICALGALFYAYEYYLRILPSVMEEPLRQHYDLLAGGFGMLSVLYYYAYVPMQLPVGVMMDHYGPRRLLTFACLICVVGTVLFASTPYFWVAGTGRFLVGFGSAFAFVGVLKLGTIWLPEDKLGFVAGLAAGIGSLGAMLGDNALGALVAHFGWLNTLFLTAMVGFILAIILWRFIRDNIVTEKHKCEKTINRDLMRGWKELRVLAQNKQMWVNGMYGCLVYIPTTVFAELWGIPYLNHARHFTLENAEFANSLIFLGFTLGAPIMGFVSDRLRQRRLPMMLGALGAALMSAFLFYTPVLSHMHIYLLLFFLGVFYSSQALVFAVGRELSPAWAAGTGMAFTNMVVMLGGMLLQPTVGFLLDLSHRWHQQVNTAALHIIQMRQAIYTETDYYIAISVIPIGVLMAFFLVFFLKETHAHTED